MCPLILGWGSIYIFQFVRSWRVIHGYISVLGTFFIFQQSDSWISRMQVKRRIVRTPLFVQLCSLHHETIVRSTMHAFMCVVVSRLFKLLFFSLLAWPCTESVTISSTSKLLGSLRCSRLWVRCTPTAAHPWINSSRFCVFVRLRAPQEPMQRGCHCHRPKN